MRLMYLHAYQSFIWNSMVTKRIQLFGFKPVIGDLVKKQKNDTFGKIEQKEEVTILNETNLNEFDIENVVLPLPGHSIIYPENMKSHYETILAKDDIKFENFKNKIK